jgi:hypothetical protein
MYTTKEGLICVMDISENAAIESMGNTKTVESIEIVSIWADMGWILWMVPQKVLKLFVAAEL